MGEVDKKISSTIDMQVFACIYWKKAGKNLPIECLQQDLLVIEPVTDIDKVFKALADPSRRAVLDRLHAKNGQTLSELCKGMDMARQSLTQHLGLLEEANLVSVQWRGREKLHYLNPVPINEIYMRWIGKFEHGRVQALHNLKQALQEKDHD